MNNKTNTLSILNYKVIHLLYKLFHIETTLDNNYISKLLFKSEHYLCNIYVNENNQYIANIPKLYDQLIYDESRYHNILNDRHIKLINYIKIKLLLIDYL